MSQQDRTTLKSYFKTGDKPNEDQFADLIDSSLNLSDDGIFGVNGDLGLGHDNPVSKLSVNGNVTVSPTNDAAPTNGLFVHGKVGVGDGFTNPTAQLAVKGGVYIGNTENTDPGVNNLRVDGDINLSGDLNLENKAKVRTAFIHPQSSDGIKLMNAAGDTKLHVDNDNVNTTADMTVGGNLSLDSEKRIESNEIRARNPGDTLRFHNNAGNHGLEIRDNGSVYVNKSLEIGGELFVHSGSSIKCNYIRAHGSDKLTLQTSKEIDLHSPSLKINSQPIMKTHETVLELSGRTQLSKAHNTGISKKSSVIIITGWNITGWDPYQDAIGNFAIYAYEGNKTWYIRHDIKHDGRIHIKTKIYYLEIRKELFGSVLNNKVHSGSQHTVYEEGGVY